jgi:hypothetical protein
MARICYQCKHYDASGQTMTCPTCQTPTSLTLLPPPGQAAAPLPGVPTPHAVEQRVLENRDRRQLWNAIGFVMRNRRLSGLVLLPFLLLFGAFFGMGRDSVQTKYDKIRVGMTYDEVDYILDPYPDPRSFRARDRAEGRWIDDDDDGHWEWQENGVTIYIDFKDGKVSRKWQKGLQK